MFLLLSLLLLLVLQGGAQLLDEDGQHLVQRVHDAALQPLGDGGAGVVEAQLLQDVVHPHRVDLTARPRDQSELTLHTQKNTHTHTLTVIHTQV